MIDIAVVVSIHAPAWGATQHVGHAVEAGDDSIHAPAWGATYSELIARTAAVVSIHAPAWGATWIRRYRGRWRCRFNPRARVGRDPS